MIYTDGIHLTADTEKELHEFAHHIGLRREWYQTHPAHPHYDLTTKRMARKALAAGARLLSSRELLVKLKE